MLMSNSLHPHSTYKLQLTVDTVTLEIGQNVLLNVEEELRTELEHVQILLLQTEELNVLGQAAKKEIVTPKDVVST